MASRLFTVGLRLPGDVGEYVPLRSDQSLFDADIVLVSPHFDDYRSNEGYQGHRLLTRGDSAALLRDADHWRAELKVALDNGKVVFVYARAPVEVYYYTGSESHSGTGRSRVTTHHVAPKNSYSLLPISLAGLTPRRGKEISVLGPLGPLAAYWNDFGPSSAYEAYYDSGKGTDLLGTKKREKVVGSLVRTTGGGALVILPPLVWDEDALTYYRGSNAYWRKEAQRLGMRLLASFIAASDALRKAGKRSPTPEWVLADAYELQAEQQLQDQIAETDRRIQKLVAKREGLNAELDDARVLLGLLFESGRPLEEAIIQALQLLGFAAAGHREGESEFDAVFTSAEGRFLGEAEGKESKAINIDKMSQLERNLQEDFARDEVEEYAKGVLFGNAFRFTPVAERGEYFTTKCVAAARRLGIALVRTPDLFTVARYVSEHSDTQYAEACRQAIFEANGSVVVFPPVPETGS